MQNMQSPTADSQINERQVLRRRRKDWYEAFRGEHDESQAESSAAGAVRVELAMEPAFDAVTTGKSKLNVLAKIVTPDEVPTRRPMQVPIHNNRFCFAVHVAHPLCRRAASAYKPP